MVMASGMIGCASPTPPPQAVLDQLSSPPRPSRDEFGSALRTFEQTVRHGRTVKLTERIVDDFALFIGEVHRRLHGQFAHRFLSILPTDGELGDARLVTTIEMGIAPDGSLASMGVVHSSGNIVFDFGAYRAVALAAPYPVSPSSIRSPDGITYVHWDLHRSDSQCGTWNAMPYLLAPEKDWPAQGQP